jgi:CheY-like chemotaxis protein
MNGHIGASSTQGAGSTFWVEVPIAEDSVASGAAGETIADSRVPSPGHAAIDNALTILYIEDNLANLNLMERVLVGRQGCRLLAAMQGSLGLQLARDHHPDLILLDLHLPDMMGHDVLRELRVDPETRKIPVIVVSADATKGQIERLLEAGAQAYLTKPIDIRELISLTQSLAKDNG